MTVAVALVTLTLTGLARLPWAEGVSSVPAAGLLLVWPTLVGGWPRWRTTWAWGPELALRFAIGSLTQVALALGLTGLGQFTIGRVMTVALVMAVPGLALDCLGSRGAGGPTALVGRLGWNRVTAAWLAVGVVGVEAAIGYWRAWSPYPFFTTWDGFLQVSIVRRMLERDQFSLSLQHLSPAFTFDAYLPTFHLDLAAASRLSGVPPLGLLWGGPFVAGLLVACGMFALVRAAGRTLPSAGLTVAVTGLLLTTRKSTNPLLDTLPASVLMSMAPLVLLTLADRDPRRGLRRGLVVAVLLLGLHGLVAALLVGVLLASRALAATTNRQAVGRSPMLAAFLGVVGTVAAVLFALPRAARQPLQHVVLDPTTFYARLTPSSDLQQRLSLANNSYPYGSLGALTAVAVVLIVLRARRASVTPLVAMPLVVLVGFVTPVIGLERLEGFLWVAAGLTIGVVLDAVADGARRLRARGRPVPAPVVASTLVVIVLLPLLSRPLHALHTLQLTDTTEHHLQSSFTPYELHALEAYAERYGRSERILSDPMTQQAAEGLAMLDSIGGVATKPLSQLRIALALTARKPPVARQYLSALQHSYGSFVLVVTGRTERWAHLYRARYLDGESLEDLQFAAIYRPWSLTETQDDEDVGKPADKLLAPVRASGCVQDELGGPEIAIFRIDCTAQPSSGSSAD